ncbi:hypothetical protein E3E42_09225 [Thermococcus sp. JdF3]|nr:hypothetical protein [Thermococcus sp. JdF3]
MKTELSEYLHSLLDRVSEYLIIEDEMGYIKDPIFGIVRNRVSAEYLKSLIRLRGDQDTDLILKLVNFLLSRQNSSGSWNEVHPNYNQESALVTSFVGEALIIAFLHPDLDGGSKRRIEESLKKARDFVLNNEIEPGYFRKSKLYTADYPNVNATCGAFLAQYYSVFGDELSFDGAKRAARRVCDSQFKNGAFPYTVTPGNAKYNLNVPCIHYQGVTLYYLSKIQNVIGERWLERCMLRGVEWLSHVQRPNGRFNWAESGLMFAYYLTGAYAFGIASFMYASKWKEEYLTNASLLLSPLKDNTPSIVLRWERGKWREFPRDVVVSFRSAMIGDYPLGHRLFRFGYALYRQISRRRFSEDVKNDALFRLATRLLGIQTSTIEPSKNFPDMFMTSEVLDSLSYGLHVRGYLKSGSGELQGDD